MRRREELAAQLYLSELTVAEIAGELGISESTVRRDLDRLGIRRRRRGPRPSTAIERRRNRVVRLYVARGLTRAQIAAALGISPRVVDGDLLARGVPGAGRAVAKRRRRIRRLFARGVPIAEIARREDVSPRTVARDLG